MRTLRQPWTPLVLALGITLAGCANQTTIGRSTVLPGAEGKTSAKAVHLDAKQRVVVAKYNEKDSFMAMCAEASPDALSAFSQAADLGLSIPTKGTLSGSTALQETAAMIGLRTQAITLMRDQLYRVCEAYYNRAINGSQVTQLLTQSQDVTLGILAIEQLTGVVAARQVALGGNAIATGTAQAATVQSLLDSATKTMQERDKEAADADAAKKAADKKVSDAQVALTSAANNDKTAKQALLEQAQREQKEAEGTKNLADARAKDAKTAKDAIEKNPTVAITSSSASAQGTSQFSDTRVQTVNLDAAGAKAISEGVLAIVKAVVERDNRNDLCFSMLSRNWPTDDLKGDSAALTQYVDTLKACREHVLGSKKTADKPAAGT